MKATQLTIAGVPEAPAREEVGLNVSRVLAWMRCRQQHEYSFVERIQPRFDQAALRLGSTIHGVLAVLLLYGDKEKAATAAEQLYSAVVDVEGTTEEERREAMQTAQDGYEIAVRAYAFLQPERWETVFVNGVPLVEQQLRCKIKGNFDYFHGTPDWVARDLTDGSIWLIDHKSRKQFLRPWTEDLNLQMVTYQHLLLENGVKAVGSRQFQIRSHLPRQPSLNQPNKKTGIAEMSRAKISSDWPTYEKALVAAGLDPAGYEAEMRPKLDTVWFDLDSTRSYRSEEEVRRSFAETVQRAAWDLGRAKKHVYRASHFFACNFCSYRELCIEELKGGDTADLRKMSFRSVDDTSRLRVSDFTLEDDHADAV